MPNRQHLDIFKSGYAKWNRWRTENPEIRPDLSDADFSFLDLSNYDLRGVDFQNSKFNNSVICEGDFCNCDLTDTYFMSAFIPELKLKGASLLNTSFYYATMFGADFSHATLQNIDFGHADLHGSKMSHASLTNVDLNQVDLTGTDLSNSILIDSDLRNAIFNGTNFEKTKIHRCQIGRTVFASLNLSTANGLNSVLVTAPCSIDFQSLKASKNLSKTFLQKIGLPELYIDYLPEFYMDALTFYPVFLSHSSKNKDFARKLYEALIAKGVNVFIDEKKIKPGDDIYESLSKGIAYYDKMILVCSKDSLAESWWVDRELDRVLAKERELMKERGKRINLLIPIRIDDYIFEWDGAKKEEINRYHIGDFREWQNEINFEKALNDLIHALNVERPEIKPKSYL